MPATTLSLTPWLILTVLKPEDVTNVKPSHIAATVFASLAAIWYRALLGSNDNAQGVAASDKIVGSPMGLLVVPVANYFLANWVVPNVKLGPADSHTTGGTVVCAVLTTYCALQSVNTILKFSVSVSPAVLSLLSCVYAVLLCRPCAAGHLHALS